MCGKDKKSQLEELLGGLNWIGGASFKRLEPKVHFKKERGGEGRPSLLEEFSENCEGVGTAEYVYIWAKTDVGTEVYVTLWLRPKFDPESKAVRHLEKKISWHEKQT